MGWADSYEEREEYLWVVHNMIPSTAGMWGQPMFTLKHTMCEDPTEEDCACVSYDKGSKSSRGIDFAIGGVWSEIMRLTDEKMLCDTEVDIHM